MQISPIYKFELENQQGDTFAVKAIFNGDVSKGVSRQEGSYFYRTKLNGSIVLLKGDVRVLQKNFSFDEEIILNCHISYDRGRSWQPYARGKFFYTDCYFNKDDYNVAFSVKEFDGYSQFLTDIDREFNLIEFAPVIKRINYDIRPCLQMYALGETSLQNFMAGNNWEQACNTIDSGEQMEELHFAIAARIITYNIKFLNEYEKYSGEYSFRIPTNRIDTIVFGSDVQFRNTQNNDYLLQGYMEGGVWYWMFIDQTNGNNDIIIECSGGIPYMFQNWIEGENYGDLKPFQVDVGNTGVIAANANEFSETKLYARWLLDVDTFQGNDTFDIPQEDISSENRNYSKCYPTDINQLKDLIYLIGNNTKTPTQWGLLYNSQVDYYLPPDIEDKTFFAVGKQSWRAFSLWFTFSDEIFQLEEQARANRTLNDAYSFADSINVILQKLGTGITHEATPEYSMVLYSSLSLFPNVGHLFLTQNTNILHGEYTQPAQKLTITLRKLLDTICNAYNLGWYIDEQNRLRIEHVYYFRNGFSYSEPEVGFSLKEIFQRSGKDWAYCRNKYKYDLSNISAQIVLKLQDKQSTIFEGYPIEILAAYAKDGAITTLSIECDTDIDFALVSPEDINKDGFTLFSCDKNGDDYSVRYVTLNDGTKDKLVLQNGTLSIYFLAINYHKFDKPSKKLLINNQEVETIGVSKNKTQEVSFPSLYDLDTTKLVTTDLGNGQIDSYTISLDSRLVRATLRYDTE
ncbi:MAG: hypothetical protein LBP67_04985 [Bacteroidales bacterium]|jgi:hypothetical protein|nr:hypothetical protein [Bacteroidales bacterium]